jgi:hypothetical protein
MGNIQSSVALKRVRYNTVFRITANGAYNYSSKNA